MSADWEKGYYCAVAKMLEMDGITGTVLHLFQAGGGDLRLIDKDDFDLFQQHGLVGHSAIHPEENDVEEG